MYQTKHQHNDFELSYLAELTRQKIKPLSRWEKPLDEKTRRWFNHQELFVDVIPRKTWIRKNIHETIFSTSSHYMDFYHRKFSKLCCSNSI